MLMATETSVATTLAAVAHFLPAACPLAPPTEGALADGADLLGQMGFAMHDGFRPWLMGDVACG
ncbi:hypothetical protein AO718_02170 [Aeromonas veronii]|nr:hypothetical protein AO718_02170 [Aeromonas veronii]KRV96566.1 hypothetical protein AO725_06500 [Aeromonas veronii]KRW06001.1 hypothetical protein AO745_09510 [Aeromonas veronii]KRW14908.1 hypothetical protein AO722_08170 [Aeromonas veronii]KRW15291.1 hypothetical protein AO732_13645 [Aeromonas veronii]